MQMILPIIHRFNKNNKDNKDFVKHYNNIVKTVNEERTKTNVIKLKEKDNNKRLRDTDIYIWCG